MKKKYYELVNEVYYKIKEGPNPDLMKLGLILVISLPMVVFFTALMGVVQKYTHISYEVFLFKSIIDNSVLYDMVNGLILKIFPFILINYYFILYKEKFKKYLDFDKYQNGRLIKWYYFIFIFPVVLHLFFILVYCP